MLFHLSSKKTASRSHVTRSDGVSKWRSTASTCGGRIKGGNRYRKSVSEVVWQFHLGDGLWYDKAERFFHHLGDSSRDGQISRLGGV